MTSGGRTLGIWLTLAAGFSCSHALAQIVPLQMRAQSRSIEAESLIAHVRNSQGRIGRQGGPFSGGVQLVWEALRGATPALAPGTMILLGLMGLLYCYRHPALERR